MSLQVNQIKVNMLISFAKNVTLNAYKWAQVALQNSKQALFIIKLITSIKFLNKPVKG